MVLICAEMAINKGKQRLEIQPERFTGSFLNAAFFFSGLKTCLLEKSYRVYYGLSYVLWGAIVCIMGYRVICGGYRVICPRTDLFMIFYSTARNETKMRLCREF